MRPVFASALGAIIPTKRIPQPRRQRHQRLPNEKGAALQEARGSKKGQIHDSQKKGKGEGTGSGDEDAGDGGGDDGESSPPEEGQPEEEQMVDALRASAGEGKESAFFQDSGAVPTKLEQELQEVSRRSVLCTAYAVLECWECFSVLCVFVCRRDWFWVLQAEVAGHAPPVCCHIRAVWATFDRWYG